MRATRTELAARASILVLRAQPAPRRVCLAEGRAIAGRGDGVAKILNILRTYCAPEAADAIRRQVVRFTNCLRTDQSVDEYIAECYLFRRKAEPEMVMAAGSPWRFASILRMNNAGLPRREKSLVIASCYKGLRFEDLSANMRRRFGSRGRGSRQDAPFSEETA